METVTAITALNTAMSSAAGDIQGIVGNAVQYAIPVAATILAITVGWRLFRNFTRG